MFVPASCSGWSLCFFQFFFFFDWEFLYKWAKKTLKLLNKLVRGLLLRLFFQTADDALGEEWPGKEGNQHEMNADKDRLYLQYAYDGYPKTQG